MKKLGEILKHKGLLTEDQLKEALAIQAGSPRRLGYIILRRGWLTQDQLVESLADQLGQPVVPVSVTPAGAKVLPKFMCRALNVVPLSVTDQNIINLAMVDPLDIGAIDDVEGYTGMTVNPKLAKESEVLLAIKENVKFCWTDIFKDPDITRWLARGSFALVAVVLALAVSFSTKAAYTSKYGTSKVVNDGVLYQNRDLMISTEGNKYQLLGMARRSKGSFAVTFDNKESLEKFVLKKEQDFDSDQKDWLQWLISQKIK